MPLGHKLSLPRVHLRQQALHFVPQQLCGFETLGDCCADDCNEMMVRYILFPVQSTHDSLVANAVPLSPRTRAAFCHDTYAVCGQQKKVRNANRSTTDGAVVLERHRDKARYATVMHCACQPWSPTAGNGAGLAAQALPGAAPPSGIHPSHGLPSMTCLPAKPTRMVSIRSSSERVLWRVMTPCCLCRPEAITLPAHDGGLMDLFRLDSGGVGLLNAGSGMEARVHV